MKIKALILGFVLACSLNIYAQDSIKQKSFEIKTILKKEKKDILLNGSIIVGYTDNKLFVRDFITAQAVVFGGNISYRLWHKLGLGISLQVMRTLFLLYG